MQSEKEKEPLEYQSRSSNLTTDCCNHITTDCCNRPNWSTNAHTDYTTNRCNCQTKTIPNRPNWSTPETEIKEKFEPKKIKSEALVLSFIRLGFDKRADRVANCGTLLEFARTSSECGEGFQGGSPGGALGTPEADKTSFKLHKANFCRDRLCPMCSWRRSYKIFGQISQIMNLICNDYEFLFLTLTIPNCEAEELDSTLSELNQGWTRLIHRQAVKRILKGYFKALEITYNKKADTYHPHFHVVLAVPKHYFKDVDYIKRDEWLQLWQKSMKNPNITQVDIRRARPKDCAEYQDKAVSLRSAIAEVAKYTVKTNDYLFPEDLITDRVVCTLANALQDRRLTALGGCFAEAHQKLQLDDCEEGDLIHIDGELRADVTMQIFRCGWSSGAYKLLEVLEKSPAESGVI